MKKKRRKNRNKTAKIFQKTVGQDRIGRRLGQVRLGQVWFGLVRLGQVRFGDHLNICLLCCDEFLELRFRLPAVSFVFILKKKQPFHLLIKHFSFLLQQLKTKQSINKPTKCKNVFHFLTLEHKNIIKKIEIHK